jgi:hypothetical protein
MSWSKDKLRKKFKEYTAVLQRAFDNENDAKHFLRLLGSKGQFDFMHEIQIIKEHFEFSMSTGNALDTLPRSEEEGYNPAVNRTKDCTDGKEANEMTKKAFVTKKIWTAELWWKKAIDLSNNNNVKYYSNLSMLQIKIGRYLRSSINVGYRGRAKKYLRDAVKRGIEIDPENWERSYQRGVQSYFALSPYEHALDAMKLLKKAFDSINEPSDTL